MERRPLKRSKSTGAPKWMVTYSDMITLILVFFILLFSMSQINLEKFDAVSESFKDRMIYEFQQSSVPVENQAQPTIVTDHDDKDTEKEDTLNKLMTDVEQYLDKKGLNNVISATRNDRGVVLVLQEIILFNPGKAEILSSSEPFLNKIGSLLTKVPNKIKVVGHTDSKPMSSFRYPSNWELSGARASSVVRYLVKEKDFDESRFTIVGFSDTRPIVPNDNPENKSKNRRVEIVILENDSNTNS